MPDGEGADFKQHLLWNLTRLLGGGCRHPLHNRFSLLAALDQDGTANKPLSDIKIYECDGRLRRPKSWARKAAKKKSTTASGASMRGIVDTGATLHLMKDESMSGLINSVQSNQSVVLSEIVFGGCCYFQWILCFGQSFPQDVGTEGSF